MEGDQLLIIVTLIDNLIVSAMLLAESFFSTIYRLENMKETQ
jgi:hypothetical protein